MDCAKQQFFRNHLIGSRTNKQYRKTFAQLRGKKTKSFLRISLLRNNFLCVCIYRVWTNKNFIKCSRMVCDGVAKRKKNDIANSIDMHHHSMCRFWSALKLNETKTITAKKKQTQMFTYHWILLFLLTRKRNPSLRWQKSAIR